MDSSIGMHVQSMDCTDSLGEISRPGKKAPGSTDGRHGALRPCQVHNPLYPAPAILRTEGVYAASGLLMHRQADPGILHHLLRTDAEPAHGHLCSVLQTPTYGSSAFPTLQFGRTKRYLAMLWCPSIRPVFSWPYKDLGRCSLWPQAQTRLEAEVV